MDENGVDVVEAIDAWIDDEIDGLTDDQLEVILGILDAVATSPLANVDAADIYDQDITELVDLVGGSSQERAYTDDVLRAALFGESEQAAASRDDSDDQHDNTDTDSDSDTDLDLDQPDEIILGPTTDLDVPHEVADDELIDEPWLEPEELEATRELDLAELDAIDLTLADLDAPVVQASTQPTVQSSPSSL